MKQLFLLVGPPGSGKSTLSKSLWGAYINQDLQGKEHIDLFVAALGRGADITVDRMNFDVGQRKRYLDQAKAAGYTTKIIVLHESYKTCHERITKRQDHPTIKANDPATASKVLNFFFSKYERPQSGEADEIEFRYPEGVKEHAIICDLDGTLCNVDHRLHNVKNVNKNWKAFFDGIKHDAHNFWCLSLLEALQYKYPLVFASGRPDDHEEVTRFWLETRNMPTEHLYMRKRGDYRKDDIAKEIILDFEILTRFRPLFFIDDRQQVVDLWRRRGFVALQCAKGDF